MKKIICIFGIIFLGIIIILNLLFTANLKISEEISINYNNWIYTTCNIALAILIFFLTKYLNIYLYGKEKLKKYIFICTLIMYILFNIIWVILVNPKVVGDSVHVCNLAQTFYRGNLEEFLPNMTYNGISLRQYMQSYHQQISLAFVYSIFFRIIHFDIMEVLRVLNIISNILIVIALYKISKQLSKNYEINKGRLLILILTFLSLPMLATFIYGDVPSLALCLFAVYFMMKYTETKKVKYPIFASIFTMIAYMMRMNSLIFIIATVIYLIVNLLKDISKISGRKILLQVFMIILYIIISIVPATFVKDYYLEKYNLDKNKAYPNISYFLMGMEESWKGNGWYNGDIAEKALKNPENIKEEYLNKIKERMYYFSKNPGYTFKFYTMKIASMWTENTYSAIRNNTLENNELMESLINPLNFYQKALLILTCSCSIIILIQNRKNLSNDLIFLITIFVGGFLFHILWEAKSRYIIPYIVVLIPIASISINKIFIEKGNKIKKAILKSKRWNQKC